MTLIFYSCLKAAATKAAYSGAYQATAATPYPAANNYTAQAAQAAVAQPAASQQAKRKFSLCVLNQRCQLFCLSSSSSWSCSSKYNIFRLRRCSILSSYNVRRPTNNEYTSCA